MKKRNYIYFIFLILIISLLSFLPVLKVNTAGEINKQELLEKGKVEFYNGNLQRSSETYNLVLKKDKNNTAALKNLILINKELGNREEVLSNYERLIRIEDNNINLKYDYGITLYESGRYKKAEKVLNQIYGEKDSGSLTNYKLSMLSYYLGKILSNDGKINEALKKYNNGINNYDANILNYLGKAEIYNKSGSYKDALNLYKKTLRKDSSLSLLYPEIALCYEELNNIEMAYYYWQKSVSAGIQINYAKKKLKNMLENYPRLQEKEKKEKDINTDIEWKDIYIISDDENIPELKIGLMHDISEIMFKSRRPFTVMNKDNNEKIFTGSSGDLWKVKFELGYYLFYKNKDLINKIKSGNILINTEHFALFNVSYGQGYFWAGTEHRQYRGKIELCLSKDNKFCLSNLINVEEYLFSVVPSEIPSWWPLESIKAQSIAARTYALKNKKMKRHDLYDLCDGVHCAVYRGVNVENKVTRKAVLATRGEVISSNERLINAVFSSNSGGYSESSEDIWGNKVNYLQGSSNNPDEAKIFPLDPFELYKWIQNKGSAVYYSKFSSSNTFRWIKNIPVNYLLDKYDLNILENISVLKRSKGGSAIEVVIQGSNREIKLKRDSIRSGLGGLKSNRFFINKIYDVNGKIKELIIYGSGWGHSVGLDQTAAAGMADKGFKYKQILTHFYNGTEITKIY